MMMTKYDLIKEFVDDLSEHDFFALWNDCASYTGMIDNIIPMEELDNLYTIKTFLEFDLSDFNIRDEYFINYNFDDIVSGDYPKELVEDCIPDEIDDFIEWIMSGDYDVYVDGLRELLDSEEYRKAV